MDASAVREALRMTRLVHDPRRPNRVHPLPEIILMSLCAILCGADSWQDIQAWCQFRQQFLSGFLSLPRGIPSHDTFGRVFARLQPLELEQCLRAWLAALNAGPQAAPGGGAAATRHVAIDGKALRRSFAHAWDASGMSHLVSVFASESRLALAQLGYDSKAGELEAIGRLLKMVDLKGCTVTIDALGCQKDIAQAIVEQQAHYVLCVKQNQPQLHQKLKTVMKEAMLEKLAGWANGSYHEDTAAGHGRIETRQVWYTTEVGALGAIAGEWPGLSALAVVQCHRQVNGQAPKVHRRYYILSDASLDAPRVGALVRGHWGIENRLHYVLDVSFGEDQCRVRKDHGPQNLSRLRRLTANLLQRTQAKASIRCKRKCCGWSDEFLIQALFGSLTPTP